MPKIGTLLWTAVSVGGIAVDIALVAFYGVQALLIISAVFFALGFIGGLLRIEDELRRGE